MSAQPLIVVFVCGVDYENVIQGDAVDWTRTSASRERALLKSIHTRPLTFVTLDVPRGRIIEHTYAGSAAIPAKTVRNDWLAITKSDFAIRKVEGGDEVVYTGNTSKRLNALNIYSLILEYVDIKKAAIAELSIFSHAVFEAPILTNTYAFMRLRRINGRNELIRASGLHTTARDPDDFDFRNTDFQSKGGQSSEALKRWKTVFSPKGYSWIWGCNEDHSIKTLMRAIRLGRPSPSRSTKGNVMISLQLTSYQAQQISKIDRNLLTPTKNSRIYTVTFGHFQEAINRKLNTTFAQIMANATNRTVLSAAPGTAAYYAANKVDMIIDAQSKTIVDQYKVLFGRSVDSANGGYIIYHPDRDS